MTAAQLGTLLEHGRAVYLIKFVTLVDICQLQRYFSNQKFFVRFCISFVKYCRFLSLTPSQPFRFGGFVLVYFDLLWFSRRFCHHCQRCPKCQVVYVLYQGWANSLWGHFSNANFIYLLSKINLLHIL